MARKRTARKAVYVISVAAELAGLHPQTLRIYERRELIKPYRTEGGTRRYSQADIDRLQLIAELTGQGLNLEGVKRVLALRDRVAVLERRLEKMERDRKDAERELRDIEQVYRHEILVRRDVIRDLRGR